MSDSLAMSISTELSFSDFAHPHVLKQSNQAPPFFFFLLKKQSNQVNFYERCQIQSIVFFFNSYVNINVWITGLFGIRIYLFIYLFL